MTTDLVCHADARPYCPSPATLRGIGPVFPGLVGAAALAAADLDRFVPAVGDNWFDPEPFIGKRGHKYFPQSARLASAAAKLALDDAGLGKAGGVGTACGLITGTNFAVHRVLAEIEATVGDHGVCGLSPLLAPNFSVNLPASLTGIHTGTTGLNITITDPIVAGIGAIVHAHHALAHALVQRVIAGATEDEPGGRSRPLTGTGVVTCGAACMFVLEAAEAAGAGVAIIAALLGRFAGSGRGETRLAARLAEAAERLDEHVLVSASAVSPSYRERLAGVAKRALEEAARMPVALSCFTDDGTAGAASPLLPLAHAALRRRDAIVLAGSPGRTFGAVVLKCSRKGT